MVATGKAPDLESLMAWRSALANRADELRAQISDLQNELAQAEERLTLVTKLLDVELRVREGGPVAGSDGQAAGAPERSTVQTSAHTPDLEGAVEEVLRAAGEPLHISTIREALLERGVPIPGRGDDANIIVRLRRFDTRFTRTARGTYGLAEWGMPALKPTKRTKRRPAVK